MTVRNTLRCCVLPLVAAFTLAGCGLFSEAGADGDAAPRRAVDPFAQQAEFFPLGAFYQSPHLAEKWREVGINILTPVNGRLTLDNLTYLKSLGMFAGGKADDKVPLEASGKTLAFMVAEDEPDNAKRKADGTWGPCRSVEELDAEAVRLRQVGGGRPILRNFGRSMAEPFWKGRGQCFGLDEDYYPFAIASADIVAFDHYPVAAEKPLEQVAEGARRLRSYIEQAGGGQAQWGIIEVSAILGGRHPTGAEMRTMAWMHIINGATGLVFFPWQVAEGVRIREDALFADPAAVSGLRALTAEITGLAAVIKSTQAARVQVESKLPHSVMGRLDRGEAYVFIVNESPQAGAVTVSVAGFEGGSVAVVGNSAAAPSSSDKGFADKLEGYEVKIYRISGTKA